MTAPLIDLYSDTLTKPSPGMRRAIAEAVVGDEQKREDPTTNLLQERVADLLGKEAALFLPSGSMCNQVAVRVHCRPGDELITDRSYHVVNYEAGGPAALSGVSVNVIDTPRGIFTPQQVESAIRESFIYHHPRTRLLSLEQTTNMGGGAIWSLEQIDAVVGVARRHRLAVHMDGARLMNAAVASGVAAKEYGGRVDTLWLDFSKGLGAPVGACIAGSKAFIEEAWRAKHQFGGAMRQSGVLAAACVYALDHNVDRLAEDHTNARLLAEGLSTIKGIAAEIPVTNLVFFDITGTGLETGEFTRRLAAHGVRMSGARGLNRIRAVTHLDVSREQIHLAIDAVRKVVAAK